MTLMISGYKNKLAGFFISKMSAPILVLEKLLQILIWQYTKNFRIRSLLVLNGNDYLMLKCSKKSFRYWCTHVFGTAKRPTAKSFLQTTNFTPIWMNLERVGNAGAGWGRSGGTSQRSPGRFRRPRPDTALTVAAGQSGDVQKVVLP